MKTLFTTIAAIAFSTSAFAGSPLSAEDSYGSILFDQGSGSTSGYTAPTGAVAATISSSDNFGSILYDLDRSPHGHTLASPPAIGDEADDYGSILYDL